MNGNIISLMGGEINLRGIIEATHEFKSKLQETSLEF
jgi:hypothetical protein